MHSRRFPVMRLILTCCKRFFLHLWYFCPLLMLSPVEGQVVELLGQGGRGTAVCIGSEDDEGGPGVFLTCSHMLKNNPGAVLVRKGIAWQFVVRANDPENDIAVLASACPAMHLPLAADDPPRGTPLEVVGYGQRFQIRHGILAETSRDQPTLIRVHMQDSQVIPGDSGGPGITQTKEVAGIISGFETDNPMVTFITPVSRIRRCLQQAYRRYSCPPGGCPLYIRQPIVGIGVPAGPPQIVAAPSLPPRDPSPGVQGPPGPQGPAGPPGPRGEGIDKEHVEAVVSAWLSANKDQLVGPQGPPGERGMIGVPSEEELQAVVDTWVSRNDTKLKKMVQDAVETELQKRPTRVILSRGRPPNAKIVDEEIIPFGKPIILNLDKFDPPAEG